MLETKSSTLLDHRLRELALFESAQLPVLTMYLNTQPDQHGRDHFAPFVRKALDSKAEVYAARSPGRESFERDAAKIADWLRDELHPSSNGAAIFACSGAGGFFETVQVDAPIGENEFYVCDRPHLYTLARINSEYPAYVAVVADTNLARIFVFGLGQVLNEQSIENEKVRSRTQVGGWSQPRYQRHIENFHLHHAKEIIDHVEKLVRQENLGSVIFAGDEVVLPVLREQLTSSLSERVIGELKLDITTPEHEVLDATLAAVRDHQAEKVAREVSAMLDQYHANGLGAAGLDLVIDALGNGQVDTLFLHTSSEPLKADEGKTAERLGRLLPRPRGTGASAVDVAGALVTRAFQTTAAVKFTGDAALLAAGGVAAALRYRV